MTKINTSVRIDGDILHWIDERVKDRIFSSRTHAFEYALRQLRARRTHKGIARASPV